MAFNLGAFAGGLARGGVDTYKLLQEIEDRKKELALREAAERRQAIDFEQRQQDIAAQRTAASESYGRIGQAALTGDLRADTGIGQQQAAALAANSGDAGFDAADRAQLADTLRANAAQAPQTAETAAFNPARPTMTRDMAADEYAKRLYAAGLTEKAQQAEATGLQISAGKRSERYAQRQEDALGFQQNVLSDLQKEKGDIAAVLNKHFIPLYNENKLPGLSDGGTAKVVPNTMGGGSTIVITDKDGKESTMPADIKTLQMLTSKAQDLMMASSTPENYWKNKEQFLKERQVGAQETSAAAATKQADTHARELDEKVKAGLFPAQANLAKAQAGQATAHAALYNNMVRLGNESKEAQAAMKPALEEFAKLTPEEQSGTKGQQILLQAATAAARKTGDITGVINALKKPDKSGIESEWRDIEKELYKQGEKGPEISARRLQFMADRGYAPPAALAVVQSGKMNNKPITEADVDAFNAKYPNSAVDKSSLSWLKASSTQEKPTAIPADRKSGERNPYVDKTGKALPTTQTPGGEASVGSKVVQAIPGAAQAAGAAVTDAGLRYIQGKIDRGEPLAANERIRAVRAGMIKE